MATENYTALCSVTDNGTNNVIDYVTHPAENQPNVSNGEKGTSVVISGGNLAALDFLGIAYIVIGFVGIIGNGTSCVVIVTHRPLRIRLANYFLINQCFVDLVISALLIISTTSNVDSLQFTGMAGSVYCYLWKSKLFVLGLMDSSTFSILAVSVERYVEVVHPIRHRLLISRRLVIAVIVATWIVGIFFKMSNQIPFANFTGGVCTLGVFPSKAVSVVVVLYNFAGEYFLPICVISFCYARMWSALRTNPAVIGPTPSAANHPPLVASKAVRARRNIFKTLFIVVVCFVVTWSFKQCLSVFNGVGLMTVNWNGVPYKTSVIMQFSSCCLNPFIYLFQYEEFQRGLFRSAKRRQIRRVSTILSSQPTQEIEL